MTAAGGSNRSVTGPPRVTVKLILTLNASKLSINCEQNAKVKRKNGEEKGLGGGVETFRGKNTYKGLGSRLEQRGNKLLGESNGGVVITAFRSHKLTPLTSRVPLLACRGGCSLRAEVYARPRVCVCGCVCTADMSV